jgi:hypothetical protein
MGVITITRKGMRALIIQELLFQINRMQEERRYDGAMNGIS